MSTPEPALTDAVRGLLEYREYRENPRLITALVLADHPDADPASVAAIVRRESAEKEN